MLNFNLPVINEPVDPLLSQLPPGFVVVVVVSPAEHHQAFGLSLPDVVEVLQQLLGVSADSLEEQQKQEATFFISLKTSSTTFLHCMQSIFKMRLEKTNGSPEYFRSGRS